MTREEAIKVLENPDVSIGVSARIGQDPEYWRKLRPALDMAISALRQQDATDKDIGKNEPLTPDELPEMDGEPVYIVDGDVAWWDIVSFSLQGWLYLVKGKQFRYSRYGEWLAYRQKPEEGLV